MCFLGRERLLSPALSQDESDGGSAGMSGVRGWDRQSRTALCCLEIHRAGPLRGWLAGWWQRPLSHHQATNKLRPPWAGGAQLWLPTSPAQTWSLLLHVRWWINVEPFLPPRSVRNEKLTQTSSKCVSRKAWGKKILLYPSTFFLCRFIIICISLFFLVLFLLVDSLWNSLKAFTKTLTIYNKSF